MKILNLWASGKTGGIEVLWKNILINSKEDNRVCCMFEEGEIYTQLNKIGIKTLSTTNCKKNISRIVKIIYNYCIKEKIDVVILHHGGVSCNLVYILLRKKLKNIGFVRYLHSCFDQYSYGNDGNIIKKYIVKLLMKRVLNISDLLVYISNAVKRSFDDNFKLKNIKNVVIYNGIPSIFLENNVDSKKGFRLNITFIGRLIKAKGINLLIKSFANVYKKNKNIKLTITGDGKEKNNLEREVNELNIVEAVEFTGRKENVIPILDKTDIFVYPSIWEEGFGISVVEAMARGCIPITFNKGGLPEIITNGVNGIIVEETSSEALAKAIEKVINMRDEEKSKMRIEAMKRARDFSIDNTISQLEKALKSL